MTEMVKFNFHGDELDIVLNGGLAYVGVRRVCDALGVAYESQIRKLKTDETIGVIMMIIPTAGGPQEMACVELRRLPLWLATIHPTKVRDEVRAKLVRYRGEAADVLADHFLGRRGQTAAQVTLAPESVTAISTATAVAVVGALQAFFQDVVFPRMALAGSAAQIIVGSAGEKEIKGKLAEYSKLMSRSDKKDARSWRGQAEMELRTRIGFTGVGAAWRDLPFELLSKARLILEEMLRRALKSSAQHGPGPQVGIPGVS